LPTASVESAQILVLPLLGSLLVRRIGAAEALQHARIDRIGAAEDERRRANVARRLGTWTKRLQNRLRRRGVWQAAGQIVDTHQARAGRDAERRRRGVAQRFAHKVAEDR